jgi:hypothetical protein
MSMFKTLAEFMAVYDPDGTRTIATVDIERDKDGNSPFIVVRHGDYTMVLNPAGFDGDGAHLCLDVYSFARGERAVSGMFGMTGGHCWTLHDTGMTSHGWSAANLAVVLVGEQGQGEGGI